jgi:hypothetical protein
MLKNVSAVTSGKEGIQKNVGREEDESVQRRGERVKQVNWNVTGNHAVLGIIPSSCSGYPRSMTGSIKHLLLIFVRWYKFITDMLEGI